MHTAVSSNDPNLARWGLDQLIGGGGLFDTGNNSSNNFSTATTYLSPIGESAYISVETPEPHLMNPPPTDVRYDIVNDEAIAHAFQEELSRLPPETEASTEDISKAAVLNQNWHDFNSSSPDAEPSLGFASLGAEPWRENYEGQGQVQGEYTGQPGNYGGQSLGFAPGFQSAGGEDEEGMGYSKPSSGSSSRSKGKGSNSAGRRDSPPDYDSYQHGDDEANLRLALALSTSEEQHQVDEEVAKRLTKLDSIRHIPRVNADELPTFDVASVDHARLLERLILYGLNERQIQGDGNCQFRALSDQLYRTPEHHKFVRKTIVTQLKSNSDVYEGYVTMPYSEYLKKIAKSGEWGDHVTLQAAADCYGVKIWLITSFKDTSFIEILPDRLQSTRVIYLSFWAEVHYNSIYPEGDASSATWLAPKKKHWLLPW